MIIPHCSGLVTLTVLLAALTLATPAPAQDEPPGFSLGVAAVANDGPYLGADTSVTPVPLLTWNSQRVSLGWPTGLRVTLFDQGDLRLSAVAAPRILRDLTDTDSAALDGIDRDTTVEAGLSLDYTWGMGGQLGLRAVTEVTDEHGGEEVVLRIAQPIPLGRVPLILGAGLTWQSAAQADYAWGVRLDEVTPTRPPYSPGEVLIPNLTVGTMLPVSANTRIMATARVDFLPDEVSSSPIVDADETFSILVGIVRNF
jgi:outer membrane protein